MLQYYWSEFRVQNPAILLQHFQLYKKIISFLYGVWGTGNITDEMVNEYLEHHRKPNSDNSNFILE
uniref:hypothetical protein n=1 Tax=Tenacibaculum gallaicum TaxID=561505 RepID=UPI00374216D0